jgi:hypothetical protein
MDALRNQSPQHLGRGTTARQASFEGSADQQSDSSSDDERAPERDSYHQTNRRADDLDENEEFTEGLRQQAELLERHSPWPCLATAELLEAVLDSLLELSQRPEVPYEFLALDSAAPFASSCCHGTVYFSRGLTQSLTRAGITFFAAHEMAHTELRHYASRQRRLEELRRAIPAAPGSAARQRMELAAVLAVRHQEEFEADHLAARWLDYVRGQEALAQLHEACRRLSPESLNRPTHPPFERRLARLAEQVGPPDPVEYLWSLVEG